MQFTLPPDTVRLAVAATTKLEVGVRSHGQAVSGVRLSFVALDTAVATVDSAGVVRGRQRGVTGIRVSLVAASVGAQAPDTVVPVRVMVAGLRLARSVDSLFALGDTLYVRPVYWDARGNAIDTVQARKIVPKVSLVSAERGVEVLASGAAVVAKVNGTDTVRVEVDTSKAYGVITVWQRPNSVRIVRSNSSDTTFSALGQSRQLSVLGWDRRRAPIVQGLGFTWGSRNPEIATVDSAGKVTARRLGSARIVAAAVGGTPKASDSVTMMVVRVPVKVDVRPDTLFVAVGDSALLVAVALDGNDTPVSDAVFSWSSSRPAVASVDARGWVTGRDTGQAWVKARLASGLSDSSLVVVELPADSVVVVPDSVRFSALGQSLQLSATAFWRGQPVAGKAIRWSSSDSLVASVSGAGLVTAVGNGTARIVARADAASDTVVVVVQQVVDALVLLPDSAVVEVGDSIRFRAEARDRRGNLVGGIRFSWSSSDTVLAKVDGSGLVRTYGYGTVRIEVEGRGKRAAAVLVVAQPMARVVVEPGWATVSGVGARDLPWPTSSKSIGAFP